MIKLLNYYVMKKGYLMNLKNVCVSIVLCFLSTGCSAYADYVVEDILSPPEQEPYEHCSDDVAMNYFDDGSNVINEESCYYCGVGEDVLYKKYKCCRDPEAINASGGTWREGINSYPDNPNTEDRQYCIYDELEFEYFLTQLDSAGWDNKWD